MSKKTEIASFAAGCFWGVQSFFDQVPGVVQTAVGYMGGQMPNPTYKEVCTGSTEHAETLQIEFNPDQISYEQLLNMFWELHDPTSLNRQGLDIGTQYRSAIFYYTDRQKQIAEESKNKVQPNYGKPIVTEIIPAPEFYSAEEYHQKYFEKQGISH